MSDLAIPDGWQQGRGAFGGLVISMLARSMQDAEGPGDRRLRSLTAALCGPVLPGAAQVSTEALRRGTGVSTWAARLLQGGEVQAHAVGVFGKRRVEDGNWNDQQKPDARPWRDVEVLPIGAPIGPVFAQHFEFRPTSALPFSGQARGVVSGWVQPKEAPAVRDAIYLAMLIDAYWPVAFVRMDTPRPIATLHYMLQVLADEVPAGPLYHCATAANARDGYTVEHRELWSEDGRLLAVNEQQIVIIK